MSSADGPPAVGHDLGTQYGDHGAVVGAQGRSRRAEPDALLGRPFGEQRAQPAVGGHPATDQQVLRAGRGTGVHGLGAEHVADRFLEAGGDVRHRDGQAVSFPRLDPAGHGGLDSGEREVEPMPDEVLARGQPAGEPHVGRIPGRRPVDRRSARIRQPEQPGDLVVRLPGRVVDGRTELDDRGGDLLHQQQRGVAAGDEQGDARLGQRAVLQQVDGDVTHQVVDPVQRLVERVRERLGGGEPDHQRPHQPGPTGDGDAVQFGQIDVGLGEGTFQGGSDGLQVRSAGHLRHHPAEPGMQVDAGGDLVGQQLMAPDQADAGLVAGGLHAHDQRAAHERPPSRRTRGHRAYRFRINACRPGP